MIHNSQSCVARSKLQFSQPATRAAERPPVDKSPMRPLAAWDLPTALVAPPLPTALG